ncbi:hypothetical protein L1D26_17265 [Vibrio mediterranei]|uniref:hypothetical protein n=1 Tax=Vibrio mediterranei TaxID=689 RepID=UPI001EFC6DA1|nr:hypothetical protein [Vibrio mediterranei]MCG9664824.1 hypothetical protein [Vibrio mediterranei]
MDFNDLIPELLVTDIDVSEEFYTAELGFSVAFRRDGFVFLSFYLSKHSVSNCITNCSSRQLTVGELGLVKFSDYGGFVWVQWWLAAT